MVEPIIEAKRQALLNYKWKLWQRSLMHAVQLKALLDIVPTTIGLNFATKYSYIADLGNIMYNGIKRALGLSEKKTVPLKTKYREPITDLKEQMDTDWWNTTLNSICVRQMSPLLPSTIRSLL